MFTTESINTVTLVTVHEELDARSAEHAKTFFSELVGAGNHNLVVDLSKLNFVDSSGLGALVSGLKAARSSHGDVRLCSLTEPVRSIFELTRLIRVFNVFDDHDAAVTSFQ